MPRCISFSFFSKFKSLKQGNTQKAAGPCSSSCERVLTTRFGARVHAYSRSKDLALFSLPSQIPAAQPAYACAYATSDLNLCPLYSQTQVEILFPEPHLTF